MGQVTRTNFGITKVIQFTNAQIKALPGTTPTLVAAITGKVILPHIISYILSPWVADYTNIDVAANVGVNINSAYTPPTLTGAGMFAQGHANILWTNVGRDYDYTPVNLATVLSQPLVLVVTNGAAGDFTGGDATTILTIRVFYEVLGVTLAS
jgi:hypothetical protein